MRKRIKPVGDVPGVRQENSRQSVNEPVLPSTSLPTACLALFVGDCHFSHVPPRCRAGEKSWYDAQLRVIHEIRRIQMVRSVHHVVYCGDIFHSPREPAQLVNFLLQELPHGYAIPGNHDLPCHRWEDVGKSPFATLCIAKVLQHLFPHTRAILTGAVPLSLHGFPTGFTLEPLVSPHDLGLEVAVVHDYCWTRGYGYEGASEEKLAKTRVSSLEDYDYTFFGDNHIPFHIPNLKIVNCGSIMRRAIDETHRPRVWLLWEDGTVTPEYLDTSQDKVVEVKEEVPRETSVNLEDFIKELAGYIDQGIKFSDLLTQALRSADERVRMIALAALERSHED